MPLFMAKLPYSQLVCGENVCGKDATVKVRTYKGVPNNPSSCFLLQLPTTSPGILLRLFTASSYLSCRLIFPKHHL